MKTIVCFIITLTLILGALGASASDSKSRYLILGPGAYLCGKIIIDLNEGVKHKNADAATNYSHWLAGYLTAYNKSTSNTYSIMGDEQFKDAFEWTLKYCQMHPRIIFAAAVEAYIKEMRPDRLQSMPAE